MKKNIFLALAGLIVGSLIGYGLFYQMGYDAAINICRAKLESFGLSQPKTDALKIASGKIISILGDRITMEIYPPTDLLKDNSNPVPFTRVGIVDDKTLLLSRSIDLSRVRDTKPGGVPASPFMEKAITIKDIALNSIVDVVAVSDINTNQEFTISKIVVNERR